MKKVLLLIGLSAGSLFGQLAIVTNAVPNPIITRAVSGSLWTLSATGGTAPYTWALSSGSLPPGLSLSSAGTIGGTATATGAATFVVLVTDATSATASKSFSITAQTAIGHGCTTATVIDWDCDYYGVGSAIGPDADDNDPTVNTPSTMLAKYSTVASFLSTVKGYHPNNIWYVSTTGNDSTCVANNALLPCASWFKAAGSMSAGDMLMLRGGTYYEEAANPAYGNYDMPSGNSSKPNIAMAYPGEKAILDHSASGWYGVEFTTYVTLDGLVIQNTPCSAAPYCFGGNGIGVNFSGASQVTNVIIRNCEIKNWLRGVWGIATQANTVIENNVIHDDYGEHNIYLGNNAADASPQGATITARNNLLYNASWDNFHFNGICTGCFLDSNIMYSANLAGGGGAANIALQEGWNHSAVQNNIVFNASAWALSFTDYHDATGCCVASDQNYNLIINNTFVHTGRDASGQDLSNSGFAVMSAIMQDALSVGRDLGHNTFANNVLVDAALGGTLNAVMNYNRFSSADLDWLTTDKWTNNIIYSMAGVPLADGITAGGYSPQQRTWSFFQTTAGTFQNNISLSPLLAAVNPAWYATPEAFNLRPVAGSPAIGAGTATGAPAVDITGKTRSTFDIGAYAGAAATPSNPCDLNGDGMVNGLDVTIAVAQTVGSTQCGTANLTGTGTCSVVDVERVITAALGGTCRSGR